MGAIYFSYNMDHKHSLQLHLVFNNGMQFVPVLKEKQGVLDFVHSISYFMGNFRDSQGFSN